MLGSWKFQFFASCCRTLNNFTFWDASVQIMCIQWQLTRNSSQVIDFELPIIVKLTVVDVDPGLKGDTAQGNQLFMRDLF